MAWLVPGIACTVLGLLVMAMGMHFLGGLCLVIGLLNVLIGIPEREREKEKEEKRQKLLGIWTEQKLKLSIPSNKVTVDSGRYLLWYKDDQLFWFPDTCEVAYTNTFKTEYDESRIKLYCVSKENIYYYAQSGELHTEVSGSGGGSSYSVLTGFHGKINPIKISTTVHDNRCTQLIYRDGDQDCEFDFAFEDIAVLRRFLPEKDYEVVAKVEAEKQIRQASPAAPKDEKEKLQKAKELLDAGLISQEEYEQARRKALADLLS